MVSAVNFGFAADGRPYLVLEALVGKSVRDVLNDTLAETRRPINPQRATNLIWQACSGIGHAHHSGIVHRDLKPDNLFLASTNSGELLVKVLDFGIAKMRDHLDGISSHQTQTGAVLGTPYYMSPEQARGERDIDSRTDIYSLAAILYELLSGERAYQGDQYNALIADIITRDPTPLDEVALQLPLGLSALVAKGMARARGERFQTAAEFARALAPFTCDTIGSDALGNVVHAEAPGGVAPTIFVSDQSTHSAAPSPMAHAPIEDSFLPSTREIERRSAWPIVAIAELLLAITGIFFGLMRKPNGATNEQANFASSAEETAPRPSSSQVIDFARQAGPVVANDTSVALVASATAPTLPVTAQSATAQPATAQPTTAQPTTAQPTTAPTLQVVEPTVSVIVEPNPSRNPPTAASIGPTIQRPPVAVQPKKSRHAQPPNVPFPVWQ